MRKVSFLRASTLTGLALLAGLSEPLVARAASRPAAQPEETVYRCKGANGQTYFGQSIPAECMDLDVEVLDRMGRVVRTIPGRRSMEQVAQQKAAAEAQAESAQRDRTLLATYLTVADIERLRDQRLEQLEQQAVVTRQYIQNLQQREERLMLDAQHFRPYSDKPKAPTLPDQTAEEIVNTVNGLRVYQEELAKNTAEREKLRAQFDADIARFKELKGIK